jgi:hypothetical protein
MRSRDQQVGKYNVLYLVMAMVWLTLALAAFVMPHINPDGNPWTIPNTQISAGWIGLLFFGYNMARWWGTRRRETDRRLLRPTPARPVHPEQPPDPNFNFSDKPPPA